jgi:hypothetical protein
MHTVSRPGFVWNVKSVENTLPGIDESGGNTILYTQHIWTDHGNDTRDVSSAPVDD